MLISGLSIDNRKKSTTEAFLTKRDQGRALLLTAPLLCFTSATKLRTAAD
jgi:hypothetical protein